MQISEKRHVKLAKYGCLHCGRFLFAPTWYKLYYNVVVCNCDASHFKASSAEVPDHIQAYWDAQFSTMSYSSYRRRLKRWTKRYIPGELPYDEAFSAQIYSAVHISGANRSSIKEALNVLSGSKLRTTLKSRFSEVHRAHAFRPAHLFENIVNFARVHHITNERFADEDAQFLVDDFFEARP